MGENKNKFFTYKGYPLVRNKDTIYYGNMYDEYVIMIKILSFKKVGDIEVADKVKVYQMSTDVTSKDPIVKTSDKNGLYEAFDIAYIWLSRANSKAS